MPPLYSPVVYTTAPQWDLTPADRNLIGWAADVDVATTGTASIGTGALRLTKITVPIAAVAKTSITRVDVAGAGLSNCYFGLYSAAGSLLAATGDQSGVWNSTGVKAVNFAATAALTPGTYYTGLLVGAGTDLLFSKLQGSDLINVGLGTAGQQQCATYGSGLTALPSTLTMASMVSASICPWTALRA
jgi:hypothetical protein